MSMPSGFVDLQVNGYAGLDFNSDIYTDEDLVSVCHRLRADGVDQVLATIITASPVEMRSRIKRLGDAISRDPFVAAVINGIHIEGPFISPEPGYVGAHPVEHVCGADVDIAKSMLDSANGLVRLVTLAPECDPGFGLTHWLVGQGVMVAGGHSNATLAQMRGAIDVGMAMFTHLGNGCPAMLPRHDNIVQRVLAVADRIAVSFIADGHHIPKFALRNYLQQVPPENVIIVTDAISAAGLGPGRYWLGQQVVDVDNEGAAWAADRSHFAGSAATMLAMVDGLKKIGCDTDSIARWTSENPRRLLATRPQGWSND